MLQSACDPVILPHRVYFQGLQYILYSITCFFGVGGWDGGVICLEDMPLYTT